MPHMYGRHFAEVCAWWMGYYEMPVVDVVVLTVGGLEYSIVSEQLRNVALDVPFRMLTGALLDVA